jgi:hypothetical protein
MERMRFTCSDKIEMPNLATWMVLANCYFDVQANVRLGRLSLREGEGEGRGRDLLKQMTSVALESLTSRLRSATARQAVLSPLKGRGGSTCNMNQVRMDLSR